MVAFKILWTIDALASLVVFYFFLVGLNDGTVSSRNMNLWLLIVGALTTVMLGSIWLKNHQLPTLSVVLLLVLAIPALLYLLFILISVFGNQKWN